MPSIIEVGKGYWKIMYCQNCKASVVFKKSPDNPYQIEGSPEVNMDSIMPCCDDPDFFWAIDHELAMHYNK